MVESEVHHHLDAVRCPVSTPRPLGLLRPSPTNRTFRTSLSRSPGSRDRGSLAGGALRSNPLLSSRNRSTTPAQA